MKNPPVVPPPGTRTRNWSLEENIINHRQKTNFMHYKMYITNIRYVEYFVSKIKISKSLTSYFLYEIKYTLKIDKVS